MSYAEDDGHDLDDLDPDDLQVRILKSLHALHRKADLLMSGLSALTAAQAAEAASLQQFIADAGSAATDITNELQQIANQNPAVDLTAAIAAANANQQAIASADQSLQAVLAKVPATPPPTTTPPAGSGTPPSNPAGVATGTIPAPPSPGV